MPQTEKTVPAKSAVPPKPPIKPAAPPKNGPPVNKPVVDPAAVVAQELIAEGAQVVALDPGEIKRGWRARQDYGDVEGLAQSIFEDGQIHPILVYPSKTGDGYAIIAGMRRVRACKSKGIKVKAIIVDPNDQLRLITLQLVENLGRKDFDVLEVSEGLKQLKTLHVKAHPETATGATGRGRPKTSLVERFTLLTAKKLGLSETKVADMLQIADLPPEKKEVIEKAPSTSARNTAARDVLREKRQERKEAKLEADARARQAERAKAAPKAPAGKPAPAAPPALTIQLLQGDCRKLMHKLAPKSIDLILADGPYDLKRSAISHATRKGINVEEVAWDKLDVGWVLHGAPLLSATGTLVAFCPGEAIGDYRAACAAAGLTYRGYLIWHKCVSADTLIPVITKDGLERLRPAEIQAGDRVITESAGNPDGGVAALGKVVAVQRAGFRTTMIKITLADGNSVTVTDNHKIPVGVNKLVEAKDVTMGDRVRVATRIPLDRERGDDEDHDMGRLAGVWLGDGGFSSSRHNRVEFYLSKAKSDVAEFIKAILPDVFGVTVNEHVDGEKIMLYASGEDMRSFFAGVFSGHTSKDKRIRPATFLRSESFVRGIVAGFCATDGSIDENKRWRFDQANDELMRDFSLLLKTIGIPSKVYGQRLTADGGSDKLHQFTPFEFREQISRHPNSTFKDERAGICRVPVVKVEVVEGCETWDLSIDSDSHLFAVDHGMLVHNSNPAPAHRSVYAPSCECIVWATKSDKYHFVPFKNAGTVEAHNYREGAVCGGNERLNHPAQKPLWLIEDLLKRHSAEGDRVLDPFAGVGTTGVACKKHKRACILIEQDANYVKKASLRLKAV